MIDWDTTVIKAAGPDGIDVTEHGDGEWTITRYRDYPGLEGEDYPERWIDGETNTDTYGDGRGGGSSD